MDEFSIREAIAKRARALGVVTDPGSVLHKRSFIYDLPGLGFFIGPASIESANEFVQMFLELAKEHSEEEFNLDYRGALNLMAKKTDVDNSEVKNVWWSGVCHYGMSLRDHPENYISLSEYLGL